MGQLWIERPNGRLGEDGILYQENYEQQYRGNTEDYDVRLDSFRCSPYFTRTHFNERLAAAGFYFIGLENVVKCYRCGQCVKNFVLEDNPRDRQWHSEGCDVQGNDHDNGNRAPLSFPSTFQDLRPREQQSQSRNFINQTRRTTQQISSQEAGSSRMDVAYQDRNSPIIAEATDDTEVYEAFACSEPFTPGMANVPDRTRTFENSAWDRNHVQATPEEIARAGFMYTGVGDRTECWYCNGCLENWDYHDDPWEEHAKWFPNCEYLLRHKGPDYVHNIVSRFPNLQRPGNEPPPQPVVAPQPPAPSFPAMPRTPAAPRQPRLPVSPRAPRLPQPPAPPIPPTHSSQNTVQLPGGITLSLTGGSTVGGGGPLPAVQSVNNGGGHTFTVRTSRGTVITYNYGGMGAGNTFIQMGGGRRNRQPQFVDPRQEEQRHMEKVNHELTNSPIVADVKNMGFDEETIRMVLLSKFLADGQMFESVDDLLDTLTQYQQELARIEPPESPGGATASTSTSNQEEEAGASAPERELRRIRESRNCRLCHRELATVVLMPCAHLAICVNCAERTIRVCPVCKRMVTETIKSFIS